MGRYLIQPGDKAATNREVHFVELGLYDYWILSFKIIGTKYPPIIEIININDAYELLKSFIAECGNTLNIDFQDGNNTDGIIGVEIEEDTMKLISHTFDTDSQNIGVNTFDEDLIEINESDLDENIEKQWGFAFDKLILTPAYILLFSKERNIPQETDNDREIVKIEKIHEDLKIYEHFWGDYDHRPILHFSTRYYCSSGLVAVLSPKGAIEAFYPEDFII